MRLRRWTGQDDHLTVHPYEVSNTYMMAKEWRGWWIEHPDPHAEPGPSGYTDYDWWRKCLRK